MEKSDYKKWAERAAAWGQAYLDRVQDLPVRPNVTPGDTARHIPTAPPEQAEDMEKIFADFEELIPPGITHWQHPRFFAYFPANASPASIVAEQLTAVIAAQCMLWQTSPAATELERVMLRWMRQALGLSDHFSGVIQDSATSSTLSAVLTMREKATNWESNASGLQSQAGPMRIYATTQTHSSVEKAVMVAGIGRENIVRVDTDENWGIDPEALETAIKVDIEAGNRPVGLILCVGGTSIGAFDPIAAPTKIAHKYGLYVHVDAAWAGAAMICPEFQTLWDGVNTVDSVVINAHKWFGVNFDCSLHYLAKPHDQVKTVGLRPDYLETLGANDIVNYSEWTVPLGRRFRALKLWFTLRAYGLEGLRARMRNHVSWAAELFQKLDDHPAFTITSPCHLSLFTFQYTPPGKDPEKATEELLMRVNDDGRIYLTQTRHDGKFVIRFQAGHFDCTRDDVMSAYTVLCDLSQPA